MPTLFLHIGTAKTGTSAIQKFMQLNEETFRSHFNLLIPQTGRDISEGSHHPLAFSFTQHMEQRDAYQSKNPAVYAREMRDEIQESELDILLTSECFAFARNGLPSFIAEVFPDYQVKVLMYARRIDQYVESAWAQHVKGRIFTESFEDFVERFEYFNYAWPSFWRKALNLDAASIVVVPYESEQFLLRKSGR